MKKNGYVLVITALVLGGCTQKTQVGTSLFGGSSSSSSGTGTGTPPPGGTANPTPAPGTTPTPTPPGSTPIPTPTLPPPPPPQPVGLLLNTNNLAALRASAANNTAQWQAFKAGLDTDLNNPITGSYQGDGVARIGDYALGYQALKISNPSAARDYADKAIAVIKSALHDYQKTNFATEQFLARGDGSTKSFTIPNADYKKSSFSVATCTVSSWAMTRSSTDLWDDTGWDHNAWFFQKVSNTNDGPAAYNKGSDWQHNGDHGEVVVNGSNLPGNNLVDWSHGAKKPAGGATYYVSGCDLMSLNTISGYTTSGTTLTFSAAPTANTLVFVSYVYGTTSTDGSTLNYQQTSNYEGGGLASIQIDSSFTSRYLGKYVAMGLDWLDDYVGFPASLKSESMAMLVRWSDYVRDFGFNANLIASNYGSGHYTSRMFTAIVLKNRDSVNGTRLYNEVMNYRQTNVVPVYTSPSTSLYGGFWAEGWGYGQQATWNEFFSEMAFANAGWGAGTEGRTWANQVIESLIHCSPTTSSIYNQGDIYSSPPAPFVNKNVLYAAAAAATSPTDQGLANYVIQNWPGPQSNEWSDMLYRNPSAPTINPSTLPTSYYASGTGLVIARNAWDFNSTWVAFQLGNPVDGAEHQNYDAGNLQIQRGGDDLLINANFWAQNLDPHTKSQSSNLVVIDDQGAGIQVYPYNEGSWFGTPGAYLTRVDQESNFVYAGGDYAAAYNNNAWPTGASPATTLTREMAYIKPDYVIVHDRVVTVGSNYIKQLRWHFATAPALNGNSWVVTAGASKLFGQTFASVAVSTADTNRTIPSGDPSVFIHETITQPTTNTTNVRYTTAMQTAPSSTSSMTSTSTVNDLNGQMEGIGMAGNIVLFTISPSPLSTSSTVTYTVGAGTVTHYLTNLQPNRTYSISGGVVSSGVANSNGVLVFQSNASGAISVH